MNFRMQVTDGSQTWWEDFNYPSVRSQQNAEDEANRMIERFNATLRPYEKPRTLLSVAFGEGDSEETKPMRVRHQWEKTNLITVKGRGGNYYDEMRCSNCGITGKRYGLGGVTPDSQYKAKAFLSCDTAKALLAKREARQTVKA